MPIGKNAIKRVSNNGYSNVKTTAPDMENSVIPEESKEVPIEVEVVFEKAEVKKPAPKKKSPAKPTTKAPCKEKADAPKKEAKSAPKKSYEREPDFSPVKTAEKVTKKEESNEREGNGYVNLGGKMPIHLL